MDSLFSLAELNLLWHLKSLFVFLVVFMITADYFKNRRSTSFPPGPGAIPIVGNIFTANQKREHEDLTEMSKKYGDVFSLRFGGHWVVVVNGQKALNEALVTKGDSVVDRPPLPLLVEITGGKGILNSSGQIWKDQRRFALSTLRNFGFAKKSLEPVILNEFAYCAKELRGLEGRPLNPHLLINNAVSNIICHLVFGHRFEYGDEKFNEIMGLFYTVLGLQTGTWAKLYNSFPWLMRYLPGPHQSVKQIWAKVKEFITEQVAQHKRNWDPSDIKDYIDFYLNKIQMDQGQVDSTFNDENLIWSVMDLFLAGSETTSTTLRWSFLYMAKYPEIQEKVRAEIYEVLGKSGRPCMEDRPKLPYTEAVIHEVQRMGNVVPLSVPHSTSNDIQLGGYTVPKGILIIPNLTSVLFDGNEWETPRTFNPGHFLNEDGKFVKKAAFLPFSAGKRLCPGESLAKMELFLFFTSFLQHFSFSMPGGVEPAFEYRGGFTLVPKPYEICITPC